MKSNREVSCKKNLYLFLKLNLPYRQAGIFHNIYLLHIRQTNLMYYFNSNCAYIIITADINL